MERIEAIYRGVRITEPSRKAIVIFVRMLYVARQSCSASAGDARAEEAIMGDGQVRTRESGFYVIGRYTSCAWFLNREEAEALAEKLNYRGGTCYRVIPALRPGEYAETGGSA